MRGIKEFFKPSLKCKRLGHKKETIKLKIRKRGDTFILERLKCKIEKCNRCFKILSEPFDCKYITGFTSVSMPQSCWDKLSEQGFLIEGEDI